MNPEELKQILTLHQRWLRYEPGGRRAKLAGANLILANINEVEVDLSRADLRCARLIGAKLIGVDLRDADLAGADLTGADLGGANLTRANLDSAILTGADLRNACLFWAYLVGADLRNANLAGADLLVNVPEGKYIKDIPHLRWPVVYTHDTLQIGCQNHRLAEWWGFSDEEISEMDRGALGWWWRHKEDIRQTIEQNPALAPGEEE